VILISGVFSKVRRFFPPLVTGSVITTIGLTLIPVAIGNMGNNIPKPDVKSVILAFITILIILIIQYFGKGFFKSISILIGLIGGTVVAAMMGVVDVTPFLNAPMVHLPTPFFFGKPIFDPSSIVMMIIISLVSMVESTGVYLALADLTNQELDEKRLRNGYRAEGFAVLLGGVFNTFPYTGFSQNVGLVQMSGIRNRRPIFFAAGFLVILGLIPKFGALAQMIPNPVLGGAMLVMIGMVALQGMRMVAASDLTKDNNLLIAAVSIAMGVGFNGTNLFANLPSNLNMFLSDGIVMSAISAIVLNLIFNHSKK
jgi:xanthine permease